MAFQVETKDAVLHAINEEFVEAVEVLLEHEETIHREGEPHVSHSGVQCDQICQNFSPFLQNFNRIWDILGIVLGYFCKQIRCQIGLSKLTNLVILPPPPRGIKTYVFNGGLGASLSAHF